MHSSVLTIKDKEKNIKNFIFGLKDPLGLLFWIISSKQIQWSLLRYQCGSGCFAAHDLHAKARQGEFETIMWNLPSVETLSHKNVTDKNGTYYWIQS